MLFLYMDLFKLNNLMFFLLDVLYYIELYM